MRITFVLPPVDMTGGIRVISIYADRLKRRGHQVVAVSMREPSPSLREMARTLIKKRQWPFSSVHKPSHFDGIDIELRRLPHCGPVTDTDLPDADVVIATWWETGGWVQRLSPAKGAKVHFMQGYEVMDGNHADVDANYGLPIPKIVIAEWMRGLLKEKYNQDPLAVVPNSVDLTRFHSPERGKQPVPTFGIVYTALPNKGCDIAFKAYELAIQQVPNLKLVTMSNYPVDPRLPLPRETEFIAQARDDVLRATYARCDAWLFSSREEGFGLPILEAMACRTPVIGTPAGAAPELLAQGGGLLVAPEDPASMAESMVKLSRLSDDEWRALSAAAWKTASSYSWDDATARFEAALEHACHSATATAKA